MKGHPLLVLHMTGATSGAPRHAVLTYSRDGGAHVVAGTANGAPRDPAWLANLRAHPEVTIEIGRRSFPASASIAEGDDRANLWAAHVTALPWFAAYPEKAQRPIPMVRLTPRAG